MFRRKLIAFFAFACIFMLCTHAIATFSPVTTEVDAFAIAEGPEGVVQEPNNRKVSGGAGNAAAEAEATSFGIVFPEAPPGGTSSMGSANASVSGQTVTVNLSTDFDHGGPFNFTSSANASAEVVFGVEESRTVPIRVDYDLFHGMGSASLQRGSDVIWRLVVEDFELPGRVTESVPLAAGEYTLTSSLSTTPIAGTSGPASLQVRLVPEPTSLIGFSSLFVLAFRRSLRSQRMS